MIHIQRTDMDVCSYVVRGLPMPSASMRMLLCKLYAFHLAVQDEVEATCRYAKRGSMQFCDECAVVRGSLP